MTLTSYGLPDGRLRFALLATVSGLALALPAGPARAADEKIDEGAAVTVPDGPYGSPWEIDGRLFVGDTGTGSLRIEAGGAVSNDTGYIGNNSTGDGTVTVTGADATWTNDGNLFVGLSGAGSLTIADGGEVSNAISNIGFNLGAVGTVTVTGAGSTWTNGGNLVVGYSDTGTLTIEDGGAVSNDTGYIGNSSGSVGTVTVAGAGSTWTNRDDLHVGSSGTGSLTIAAGGTVSTNGAGYIGSMATGDGTVTVTGAGSTWTNTGMLTVGNLGTGRLTIEAGGKVSNGTGHIGNSSGGDGTVTVTGAGSTWANSGDLRIGNLGTGTLRIADGGAVDAATTSVGYGSLGTLVLAGTAGARGVLTTEWIAEGTAGNAAVVFDGGILRATADQANFLAGFEAGDVTIAEGGAFIDSNGHAIGFTTVLSGTGGLTKTGAGTLTLRGTNSYTGGTAISGGTLAIAVDANLGDAAGGLSFDGGTLHTTADLTTNRATTLGSGGGTFETAVGTTLTHGGAITGAGQLTKTGAGTLTLSGANSYAGGTTVAAGTLAAGAADVLGGGRVQVADGATLELGGHAQTVGSLAGSGDVVLGGATLTAGGDGTSTNFSGTVSGAGGLTKQGTGTLTLSGTNTYTGGTTISAGTLQGDTASLTGDITNNAALTFDQDSDGTFGGTLSGTGSLTKTGAGTLTLSGTNTYTGGTTISAGTLQGDTASLTGDITNNAALAFDQDSNGTFGGTLSGTGSLTKTGAGTLTLSGANTYSGGTAITGGTLEIAADANLGDAAGGLSFDGGTLHTIADLTTNRATTLGSGGGTFETAAGTTLTHGGAITGAGQLTKQGAGTLALTGSNGYEGGTLVLGGELVVDADSLPGDADVSGGAFLTFEQDADGSYTGIVSGAGGVRVNGDGTLTFTAIQAYSGETAIDAGALQATTASLRGAVSVGSGAALILNQDSDGSYAGAVSGAGRLVKTGAGAATLTDTHTHTGGTIVNAGTLRINGALASLATVGANGVLGGSGAFLGGVDNRGTLAPGNSIGTMTVTGPLTFDGGAVYEVEVDAAGQSDRIDVDGTATLAGTVRVLPETGEYAQETDYVILTASDAITTTFDAVETSSAFLDPSLSYGANAVTLRLTRNDAAFESVAATPNQRAVAGALDQAGATGDIAAVVDAVAALSAEAARNAYDQLAGASLAAFPTVQLLGQARFDAAVRANALRSDGAAAGAAALGIAGGTRDYGLDQMAALGATLAQLGPPVSAPTGERGLGVWASGYGIGGQVDGDGNAAGFDHLGGGIVAGVDWRVTDATTVGLAFGYGRSNLDHDNGDDGEIDTVRASLYGAWRPAAYDGRLVFDGGFGAGLSDYETERRIAFAGLDRTAEGETDGYELSARLGAGYRLDLGAWQMTPQAGLSYVRLHQDGYAETGAGAANLVVEDQAVDSVQGRLGLAVARTFTTAAGMAVTPAASLAWRHEFADDERVIDATLAGVPGAAFRIAGADADRNALELGLGLSATMPGGTIWYASYSADLADTETAHGLLAGVRIAW